MTRSNPSIRSLAAARRILAVAGLVLATAVVPREAEAQPGTYLLDATDPANGHMVTLLAGEWSFAITAGAFSAWSYVQGCDANGANCHTGFETFFDYQIDGGALQRYNGANPGMFATPELAFLNAPPPLLLTLDAPSSVRLFLNDCCYGDNRGSVEVTVAEQRTAVPEPGTAALMACGALALVVVGRRRRTVDVE